MGSREIKVNISMIKKQMNSVATTVFTAHTVLQGSQQGNETSIQHVAAIVQTHQVAVEHPAELQTE